MNCYYYHGKEINPQAGTCVVEDNMIHITLSTGEQYSFDQNAMHDVSKDGKLLLRSMQFPYSTLHILDASTFYNEQKKQGNSFKSEAVHVDDSFYGKYKGILLAGAFVLAAIAGIYFYVMPWGAEKMVTALPKSWDKAMGENGFKSMQLQIDSGKTRWLNDLIDIAGISPASDSINFYVANKQELNAFALPGGPIVVYDSLIRALPNPQALLGVIGHELAHVYYRHSMRSMARHAATYIVIAFVLGDMVGISSFVAERITDLERLHFSRDMEREADLKGIEILTKAGVSPSGMLDVMRLFKSNEKGVQPFQIFLTHPVSEERFELIEKSIPNDFKVDQSKAEMLDEIWKFK